MLTSCSLIYTQHDTVYYTAVFTRNDIVFSNCKSKSIPVGVVLVTNEIVNVSSIVNCALYRYSTIGAVSSHSVVYTNYLICLFPIYDNPYK